MKRKKFKKFSADKDCVPTCSSVSRRQQQQRPQFNTYLFFSECRIRHVREVLAESSVSSPSQKSPTHKLRDLLARAECLRLNVNKLPFSDLLSYCGYFANEQPRQSNKSWQLIRVDFILTEFKKKFNFRTYHTCLSCVMIVIETVVCLLVSFVAITLVFKGQHRLSAAVVSDLHVVSCQLKPQLFKPRINDFFKQFQNKVRQQ